MHSCMHVNANKRPVLKFIDTHKNIQQYVPVKFKVLQEITHKPTTVVFGYILTVARSFNLNTMQSKTCSAPGKVSQLAIVKTNSSRQVQDRLPNTS